MANAVNTGSTLTLPSTQNKTNVGLSTHILIMVNNRAVGAVQSLSITESRSIKQVDEVGTDGHIDSAPQNSTNITGNCTRIRYDRLRLLEAFGRGFVHLSAQRYPFDIVLIDRQKQDTANHIITVIKNVWAENLEYTLNTTDWIIQETMRWQAETIFSFRAGNVNVATGGEIGMQFNKDTIEQATDKGLRRGSLDASGLIDLSGDNLF